MSAAGAAAGGAAPPPPSVTSVPPLGVAPAYRLPAVVATREWLVACTTSSSSSGGSGGGGGGSGGGVPLPAVTASWAQAVDGTMAVRVGAPSAISSAASLEMTHALRAVHDAILVGVGTLLADDPRLNVRVVDGRSPRPVVLDTALRLPPAVKLLTDAACVRPIVYCSAPPPDSDGVESWRCRRDALAAAGATVVELPPPAAGGRGVDLLAVLADLRRSHGVASVMVEGGPTVLRALFAALAAAGAAAPPTRVVITIAPTIYLGAVGLLAQRTPPPPPVRCALAPPTACDAVGTDWVLHGWLSVPPWHVGELVSS